MPSRLIVLDERPLPPALVIHMAKRVANVAVPQVRVEREEPIDVDRHVLEFRKPIEVPASGLHVEIETLRQVEDERRISAHLKDIAFAAGLGGTKEIVEVGCVQLEAAAPVETLVVGLEVQALRCGRSPAGEYARIGLARLN